MKRFKKWPQCEECWAEPATSFSFIRDGKFIKGKGEPVMLTGKALFQAMNRTIEPPPMDPYLPKDYCGPTGRWRICGNCTSTSEMYYIRFDSFFGSYRSTIDWLAHMHEKDWMNWEDFMNMMDRFREATGSYWAI